MITRSSAANVIASRLARLLCLRSVTRRLRASFLDANVDELGAIGECI
jgi:hypothetical protein